MENIKELMLAKNWSGQELARNSKQKTSDIYNILYGKSKKPSADKVEAIAQAFGVSVSTLLHGKNDKPDFIPSNDEWDGLLYNDSMTVVRSILAKRGIKFDSREEEKRVLMKYTMRVYNYARKKGEETADAIFAEDIISQ